MCTKIINCISIIRSRYGATDELPSAHEDIDSLGRVGCEATDAVHGRSYCTRQVCARACVCVFLTFSDSLSLCVCVRARARVTGAHLYDHLPSLRLLRRLHASTPPNQSPTAFLPLILTVILYKGTSSRASSVSFSCHSFLQSFCKRDFAGQVRREQRDVQVRPPCFITEIDPILSCFVVDFCIEFHY